MGHLELRRVEAGQLNFVPRAAAVLFAMRRACKIHVNVMEAGLGRIGAFGRVAALDIPDQGFAIVGDGLLVLSKEIHDHLSLSRAGVALSAPGLL